jgi:hypothetical protein
MEFRKWLRFLGLGARSIPETIIAAEREVM